MAPEVLEKRPYRGTSVDIFSAGVVLFTMITGSMPFETSASIGDHLYQYIVSRNYQKYWEEWEKSADAKTFTTSGKNLRDDFKDLIVKMVAYDYVERPTLTEIKNHSWFK
jgi:serine/threonine protein kinase